MRECRLRFRHHACPGEEESLSLGLYMSIYPRNPVLDYCDASKAGGTNMYNVVKCIFYDVIQARTGGSGEIPCKLIIYYSPLIIN